MSVAPFDLPESYGLLGCFPVLSSSNVNVCTGHKQIKGNKWLVIILSVMQWIKYYGMLDNTMHR